MQSNVVSNNNIASFRKNAERGQGLVEYALILVLVAVVVIVILALMGPALNEVYFTVMCPLEYNGAQGVRNPNDQDIDCRAGGDISGTLYAYYDAETNAIVRAP